MAAARRPSMPKNVRKPTLSPTKFRTYLECAVMYRYVYVEKIGRFFTRARPGYSFGSTLHNVLQEFHEQGAQHSAEELTKQVSAQWIGAGYASQEQEEAQRVVGEQIVQAYVAAHQERAEVQVETMATEKTISHDMGRFRLMGRVDRIDRHADGSLEIIDYKSGRREVTPEEVAGSLAMNCYQLILKRLHPENRVKSTIYCLLSGNTASSELTAEDLSAFESDLLQLGEEILDRDYTALDPVPLEICPTCDFLPRCQRFWDQKQRLSYLDAPHFEGDD